MARNQNGTFAQGNKAAVGHGRPARRIEASYLVSMTKAVSEDDWQAIVQKAVEQAKDGDYKARDWLGHYLLGATDPTRSRPTLAHAHAIDPEWEIEAKEAQEQNDRLYSGLITGFSVK